MGSSREICGEPLEIRATEILDSLHINSYAAEFIDKLKKKVNDRKNVEGNIKKNI